MIEYPKLNRVEVIDWRPCPKCSGTGRVKTETDSAAGQSIAFEKECPECNGMLSKGRSVIVAGPAYNMPDNAAISMEFQDDDRTLKIFIKAKDDNES